MAPEFDGYGRPVKLTLPLQGIPDEQYPVVELTPVRQRDACIGFEPQFKLIVLTQKYGASPKATLQGVIWCVSEKDGDNDYTDPEPIGIWGAEERDDTEWRPED